MIRELVLDNQRDDRIASGGRTTDFQPQQLLPILQLLHELCCEWWEYTPYRAHARDNWTFLVLCNTHHMHCTMHGILKGSAHAHMNHTHMCLHQCMHVVHILVVCTCTLYALKLECSEKVQFVRLGTRDSPWQRLPSRCLLLLPSSGATPPSIIKRFSCGRPDSCKQRNLQLQWECVCVCCYMQF